MAAKASKVTASFTVSFSTGSDGGILVAEVDDRTTEEGGLNDSTSFKPGQDVAYLVYLGPGVTIDNQYHSYGSDVAQGSATVLKEEDVTFTSPDSLEQTLKYPIKGNLVSCEAIGAEYPEGKPKLVGNTLVVKKAKDTYGVGIYRVTYNSVANVFKLKHAPLGYDSYEIVTQVVGTYDPSKA